jgi:hypothetical protein
MRRHVRCIYANSGERFRVFVFFVFEWIYYIFKVVYVDGMKQNAMIEKRGMKNIETNSQLGPYTRNWDQKQSGDNEGKRDSGSLR